MVLTRVDVLRTRRGSHACLSIDMGRVVVGRSCGFLRKTTGCFGMLVHTGAITLHAHGSEEGACDDKVLAFLGDGRNVASTIKVL